MERCDGDLNMGVSGSLHTFNAYWGTFQNPYRDTFYTSNPGGEAMGSVWQFIASNVWNLFMSSNSSGVVGTVVPVYRFWTGIANTPWGSTYWGWDHYYSTSSSAPGGYYSEGIVGYAYPNNSPGPNRVAVYSFYNPTTIDHKYKTSSNLPYIGGYVAEGIAWYSPILVYGCGNSSATNYNPYVNQSNSGCNYTIYGCTDPLANNYNSSANQDNGTCTYTAATATISVSPSAILVGGTSTLSWYTNYAKLASISGIGSVGVNQSGSQSVSPSSTTSYTLTATNYGNANSTASTTLTVYQPPVITLSTNAVNNTITQGQSCNLTWTTTGDNSESAQLSPISGSVPASSSIQISPTVTTTYTISINGYLGTNDSDQITITVLQPPEANVSSDPFVLYGEDISVEYSTVNAVQVSMIVTYYYLDGSQHVTNEVLTEHSDSVVITPSYNNFGPSLVTIKIDVEGYGTLTEDAQSTTAIIIDETPDFSVPESRDKLKDEDPVITPDSTVTTTIEVADIDIPVEIKSNHPIKVEVEDFGWVDLKEI